MISDNRVSTKDQRLGPDPHDRRFAYTSQGALLSVFDENVQGTLHTDAETWPDWLRGAKLPRGFARGSVVIPGFRNFLCQ